MQYRILLPILCLLILFAPLQAEENIIYPSEQKSAPLDSLAAIAAFAAAIAIAYAGLPDFRHREKVQKHVREIVRKHELMVAMGTKDNLWGHECWAILRKLGRLNEIFAIPIPKDDSSDHNFVNRQEFIRFSWLFSSNLDKKISIALGALAASILWFSALDRINYVDGYYAPKERIDFFIEIIAFYRCNIITLFLGILAHIRIMIASA